MTLGGPPCLQDAGHGRLYDLPTGRWFCPHARHVGRAIYGTSELPAPWGDGVPAGAAAPAPTRAPSAGVEAPRRGSTSVRLKRGSALAESTPAQMRLRL